MVVNPTNSTKSEKESVTNRKTSTGSASGKSKTLTQILSYAIEHRLSLTLEIPSKSGEQSGPRSAGLSPSPLDFAADLALFLRHHSLFSCASEEFIDDLAKKMHLRHYHPGDSIIREGEIGRAMFFIIKGYVTVSSKDGESIFADLGPGKFFGEIGVLFEVPRTANVVAKTRCNLAVLTQNEVKTIMQNYPEIEDEIRYEGQERYAILLKKGRVKSMDKQATDVHEFHRVPEGLFMSLVELKDLKVTTFEVDAEIYRHEQIGHEGYIIKSGNVELRAENGRTFIGLSTGCFFGFESLLKAQSRNETAIAVEKTELIAIGKDEMFRLFKQSFAFENHVQRASKRSFNWHMIHQRANNPNNYYDDLGRPKKNSIENPEIPLQITSLISLNNQETSPPSISAESLPQGRSPRKSMVFDRSFFVQSPAPIVTSAQSLSPTIKSLFELNASHQDVSMSADAINSSSSRASSMLHPKSSNELSEEHEGESFPRHRRKSRSSGSLRIEEITDGRPQSASQSERHHSVKPVPLLRTGSSPAGFVDGPTSSTSLDSHSQNSGSLPQPPGHSTGGLDSQSTLAKSRKSSKESVAKSHSSISSQNSDSSDDESENYVPEPDDGKLRLPPTMTGILAADPKRRRASVAVWADSKLTEIANSKQATPASPTSRLAASIIAQHDPVVVSHSSIVQSLEDSVQESNDSDMVLKSKEEILTDSRFLSLVLSRLPFKHRWRLRRVCSAWNNILTTSYILVRHIDLSDSPKIVDDTVVEMLSAKLTTRLEIVVLKNCWKVTNTSLIHLAKNCKNLNILDLCGCWEVTDDGLTALSLGCRYLRSIDLSNCRKITDRGIQNLLANCPNMMDIFLSYCKALTDSIMSNMSSCSPNIRRLNLQRCLGITDHGYTLFAASRHFKLQELNLSDCSFLTDVAVNYLASSCPNLRILNLSFCCALTDQVWPELVRGCKRLQILDVSFCGSAVSDDALTQLSQNLVELERLSIRGCVRVTDVGIDQLIQNAQALKRINMSNCKNITQDMMKRAGGKYQLLTAQTPLVDSMGITSGDKFGSGHLRRFTA